MNDVRTPPIALTHSAKMKIQDEAHRADKLLGAGSLPALLWVSAKHNPNYESQVALGFYSREEKSQVDHLVYVFDGLRVAIVLDDDGREESYGRTVDFADEKFVVID
jgi:hypothetical protein